MHRQRQRSLPPGLISHHGITPPHGFGVTRVLLPITPLFITDSLLITVNKRVVAVAAASHHMWPSVLSLSMCASVHMRYHVCQRISITVLCRKCT